MAVLQEEVKQMKLRELETLRSFREMQDTVAELNQRWQVAHTHSLYATCMCCNRSVAGEFHCSLCVSAASHVPRQQHRWWRWPLEGIPKEERHERAAGQTDDRQTEGGPGPGRAPRAQAESSAAGEPGQTK